MRIPKYKRQTLVNSSLLLKTDLNESENLPDVIQSTDVEECQGLKEPAGSDDHEKFGEQVEVSLEVLHGSVVNKLLPNLSC